MDDLIRRFRDYQIEWLTAHNDIEFCEEEEKMIIGFLKDTAESFVRENQSAKMDDLIKRQDAVKSMTNAIWHYPNEMYAQLNSYEMAEALAKDGLMFIPSAQQWIPCSERMPEKYDEVWVTLRGSDMIVCKDGETLEEAAERVWKENIRVSIGFYGSDGWYGIDGYPSMLSPVAWMPMNEPEPYKGENDG